MVDKIMLLLFMTLASCASQKVIDYTNVIITEPGLYSFEDVKLEIEIINNLVKYNLLNTDNKIVAKPEHNFSSYQKWMALWDGERLWFDSSDIGGEVWVKDNSGKYKNISFTQLGLLSEKMPREMYQKIVNNVKSHPKLYNWKPTNRTQ